MLASTYSHIEVPVLILLGQYPPGPTRLVAETLAALIPNGRPEVVGGAGHMGSLMHAAKVNALFKARIGGAQSKTVGPGQGRPAEAVLN